MGNWDATKPTGSDPKSQGDDQIRELKGHIAGALGIASESVFDAATDPANPKHRYRGLKGTTAARPSAGNYGLYFDTDRQQFQRDNGSTWDDIGTNIVQNTKMFFPQATAPTGFTKDTTHHGKTVRLVTDTNGGGSGGSHDPATAITLAHDHTVASHTHDLGNHTHAGPSHNHSVPVSGYGTGGGITAGGLVAMSGSGDPSSIGAGQLSAASATPSTGNGGTGNTGAPSSNTSGAATPSTDSKLSDVSLAYVNAIIATKN